MRDSHAIHAYNFGWANGIMALTVSRSYSLGEDPRLPATWLDVVTDPFAGIRVDHQVNGSDTSVSEPESGGIWEWSANLRRRAVTLGSTASLDGFLVSVPVGPLRTRTLNKSEWSSRGS
jgi:hypothetical protein